MGEPGRYDQLQAFCPPQIRLFQFVPLFLQNRHREEFIGPDLIETNTDTQLQRCPEIECPPDQQPGFGILSGVELVEKTVVTAAAAVGSIRTEAGVAQFVASQ